MKRDKLISLRVNSDLLEKVNNKIMSKTTIIQGSRRNYYHYHDDKRSGHFDKFTIADLLEEKLRSYLQE